MSSRQDILLPYHEPQCVSGCSKVLTSIIRAKERYDCVEATVLKNPHKSTEWVVARELQANRNCTEGDVVRWCGQKTVTPNLQEWVPLSFLALAVTQLSLGLLPDGAVCRAGSWCVRHPALPLVVTNLGGTARCPHTEQRSPAAPREPRRVCSLPTQGTRAPGCGPGSRPAQHAPSGHPKPFQKIPGVLPILQYEVVSLA